MIFIFFVLFFSARKKEKESTWFAFELWKETADLVSAGFDAGARAARSYNTVFVRLVFSLCILYLLGRFSDVSIGCQPLPLFTNLLLLFFFLFILLPSFVIYCAIFFVFIFYAIVFFYTHILTNMYIKFCF